MRGVLVAAIMLTLVISFTGGLMANDGVKAIIIPTEKEGIKIWVDKDCYKDGESLTIRFQAERSGYLTIYDFTPDGQRSILFPNAYYPDNKIKGGVKYQLPAPNDPFRIQVKIPPNIPSGAKEILWAVITEEKVGLPKPTRGESPRGLAIEIKGNLDELGYSTWWASDMCEFSYGPCESRLSVTCPGDQTVDEGSALSGLSGSFTDSGKGGWSGTVDWGDGSAAEAITINQSAKTYTLPSHTYADNGSYTVTVTVMNDDGSSGSCSFTVRVNNVVPPPSSSGNYALVIGINDYIDKWVPSPDDPEVQIKFPKLHGCVPDAKAITDAIRGEFDHIKLILDHDATYENIKAGFRWLRNAGPNSKVLIFYSGHGATQKDFNGDEKDGRDETLVPYNWADARKFIVDDEVNEWIAALKSKEVLMVVDSCHSGTIADLAKSLTALQLEIRTYQVRYLDRGYLSLLRDRAFVDIGPSTRGVGNTTVISLDACKANETALEVKLKDDGYHGMFTSCLLLRLKYDRENGSRSTARELFAFASDLVVKLTTGLHKGNPQVAIQHPFLEANSPGDITVLTHGGQ